MIKVFEFGDGPNDFIAAPTKQSALECYKEAFGFDDLNDVEIREMTDAELDIGTIYDADDSSDVIDLKKTMRQLILERLSDGDQLPFLVCVTED